MVKTFFLQNALLTTINGKDHFYCYFFRKRSFLPKRRMQKLVVEKLFGGKFPFLARNWTNLPVLGQKIPFSDIFNKFSDIFQIQLT